MNPGDTGHDGQRVAPPAALNEGRGMNPGDTSEGLSERAALKSLGIRDYARHCETDVGQTPVFIGGRASSTRRRRIRSFDPGYSGTLGVSI